MSLLLRSVLLAALLTAATAATATAATLSNENGTLTYTGGEGNGFTSFAETETATGTVRVTEDTRFSDRITGDTPGCIKTADGAFRCSGVRALVAAGGAGNDQLDATGVETIPATLSGDAGGDFLTGGEADDTVNGGDGGDVLSGWIGDNTLNGDGGGDTLYGDFDGDTLNGGHGRDDLLGGPGADTLNGGADGDYLDGRTGTDTLDGGEGGDDVHGGADNDALAGGEGDDLVFGEEDDDTVDGSSGDDVVTGSNGDDVLRGGAGDDVFSDEPGNEDVAGGSGVDSFIVEQGSVFGGKGPPIVVSLDDAANDRGSGVAGETDNIRADVENAFFDNGADSLTGSAGANSLSGFEGDDVIDGLAGNDVLTGGSGDDRITARDGFFDLVSCSSGNDTAIVDTLDRVDDCEDVQRADVGNANDVPERPEVPEDGAPTVAFTTPASGAKLSAGSTTLTATATDDRGVASVLFVDDERIVCTDTTAPYACDYQPRGEDVGRNTLVVIAVDTAQQTATATRSVAVDRFAPTGFTGAITPARDVRAPFRFRTSGRLRLPTGIPAGLGCKGGVVSIQVKAGSKTISNRRAELKPDCSFVSTVAFKNRKRFTRSGRLKFTLRFTGNEVLSTSAAVVKSLRTR